MSQAIRTGLLISLDGLDSSGKATQSKRLVERLRFAGFTAHLFSSPDYTTPSGQKLKMQLQNKAGDWHLMTWQEKMGLFSNNRAEHRDEVQAALARGEMVVYDRYVPSSLAFMAVESGVNREEVYQAVKEEEYTKNGMPLEDASLFLDVPARITCGLLMKRKDDNNHDDEYTDELKVQERLYDEYDFLCNSNPSHYLRIMCLKDSELLLVADVTELIWQSLLVKFPSLNTTL